MLCHPQRKKNRLGDLELRGKQPQNGTKTHESSKTKQIPRAHTSPPPLRAMLQPVAPAAPPANTSGEISSGSDRIQAIRRYLLADLDPGYKPQDLGAASDPAIDRNPRASASPRWRCEPRAARIRRNRACPPLQRYTACVRWCFRGFSGLGGRSIQETPQPPPGVLALLLSRASQERTGKVRRAARALPGCSKQAASCVRCS